MSTHERGRQGSTVEHNGSAGRKPQDRKSTLLNSSHSQISYAVFCLKKKKSPRDRAPLRTAARHRFPGRRRRLTTTSNRLQRQHTHVSRDPHLTLRVRRLSELLSSTDAALAWRRYVGYRSPEVSRASLRRTSPTVASVDPPLFPLSHSAFIPFSSHCPAPTVLHSPRPPPTFPPSFTSLIPSSPSNT